MESFTNVLLYVWEWCGENGWSFYAFDNYWTLTFRTIFLLYPIALLTIFAVKKLFELLE